MIRGRHLYVGAMFTAIIAFAGFVFVPQAQLARLSTYDDGLGNPYPAELSGQTLAGQRVYCSLGCAYCHSQQIRAPSCAQDTERGWGTRRTVPRDYLNLSPPLLGTQRTGPDLANVGTRRPDPTWHHLHLFAPEQITPGSLMPPHTFLYEEREINPILPAGALHLTDDDAAIIPSTEAEALVAYLRSLRREHPLPEVGP